MKIVVDTSVWLLALRRTQPPASPWAAELGALIREGRAVLIGPVRQELLSGVKDAVQFARVRDYLRALPDLPLEATDFEEAALAFNLCRARGIQGSNTDFLICAAAVRRRFAILTTDRDFSAFSRVLPVSLHEPRR